LSNYQNFEDRHIGPSVSDESEMLGVLGYSDLKKFIADVVPENIVIEKKLAEVLDSAKSEVEVIDELRALASENEIFTSLIGTGYYGTITPPVIKRNVLENPAWYTAYTPYQAEIAQGRLEAILNFQTMVMDLTGMEIANASLLDEGTAAAEAMTMLFHNRSREATKRNANKFFVDQNCFAQTTDVLKTRAVLTGRVYSTGFWRIF
jgi:glycine dehydrogenase